jgi:hypothetical protein
MSAWTELLSKTSIANITASAILLGTLVYAVFYRDVEVLRSLAFFSAGWLFGVTATKMGPPASG